MKLTKPQKLVYDMEQFAGGAIAVICGSMLMEGECSQEILAQAIHDLYRLNDALRMHIVHANEGVELVVTEHTEEKIDVLCFENKAQLDSYASDYAKAPIDLHGDLCEIKIVELPGRYGILVKMHHLIGDAWTLSMLGSQLQQLLDGETPEAYSYTEYESGEAAYLSSKRCEKDKAFFMEQFAKCEEVTYLSDKQVHSYAAERKTVIVEADEARILTDYMAEKNTTAFPLFMTALAIYMSRIKLNVEKFYIGTAVLNRTSNKEKNTMGMYINTVPVLMELNNKSTFAENLGCVEEAAFGVFRHQKYNYGDVLTDIRKEYSFTEKLYDIMLSYQNATLIGDAESTWYHSGMQTESLQIHIDDRDNKGVFRVHYDYQIEKFTAREIERMHRHIMTLLLDAISNEDKKLHELSLLTEEEAHRILVEFNDTKADYPRDKCVHTLFEEQAVENPNKTAVIACDGTLTYDQLNRRANRIAHGLIAKGIQPGDIVAFMLPRTGDLLAVIFGILKAGAAYLPIDLELPQERIDYTVNDSCAKLLITETVLSELLKLNDEENPNLALSSESFCYCIYTSGSTGKPKGVMIRHRNLVNVCSINQHNTYQRAIVEGGNTLLSTAKCCFDAFAIDYALVLLNGCTMVLAADSDIVDGRRLAQLIANHSVTAIQSTPSAIRTLCTNEEYTAALQQIKVIILAAESFFSELYPILRTYTNAEIFNGYGPTETTVGAAIGKVTSEDVHIGRNLANTQIYILDNYDQIVPQGAVGQICIGGAGVGAGYLNRPELTAEKFVENIFGEGKLYKTGDLAYWREDGNLAYVGRNDYQVKIRGLRIELGEIENALDSVEGISQAVVVVRKNESGRQLICAFYTGEELDAGHIWDVVKESLPRYMLPHVITHVDTLPLTISGKVNRNALPAVDLNNVQTQTEYIAPSTPQEVALTAAVQSVLTVDKVGILDHFFDLGGDSLKAIELIAHLEKMGYTTDAKTIFACDTIKDLAAVLTLAEQQKLTWIPLGDIPATPAQMRVYTAQSMQLDSTLYNMPCVFRTEQVDAVRLQAAVEMLIKRHDMFRTHFEEKDGTILQVVEEKVEFALEELTSDDIAAFVRPFNLDKAPLLRVGCYKNTVMIDMHHIITDGGSMPVFLRELNDLYMGRILSGDPTPYTQFAIRPQTHSEDEQYWLSVYGDEVPVLELNTDFKRGQKRSYQGSAVYSSIDGAFHQKVLEKCHVWNITPYVFYMGAFYVLLAKFSGNEDIVVGMPISGREGEFLNTVGMFVNTIALRNRPEGSKTVREFLHEVKTTSVEAISHQSYPYGELVKKLGLNAAERNPLFDVMFAYQSDSLTAVTFGDKSAELLPIPVTTAKYDISFNVMPRSHDVVVMAEFCTALYRKNTAERLTKAYEYILHQMLDANICIKDITAVTIEEENTLCVSFNDTKTSKVHENSLYEVFEKWVEKRSNVAAVAFEDYVLTYSELHSMVENIASNMAALDVCANDIVAVHLNRSHLLIAFQLATLKLGSVFLPVDKRYPADRIQRMCNDCCVKLFITDEICDYIHGTRVVFANEFVSQSAETSVKTHDQLGNSYMIYTSGSTGTPKGCVLTGAGLLNFVLNNNTLETLQQKEGNIFACVNSVSFDYFIAESLLPLLNGYTTVVLDDECSTNQEAFLREVKCHGINVLMTTPTRLKIYFADNRDDDILKQLTCICTSGEPLPQELLSSMWQKAPDAKIYNPLGPSECTVWDVGGELDRKQPTDIHIGKPIANTQIHIVDKEMHLVPIGVTGELCIAGDGVGAGYLNRPELTAEKFVDNPFGEGKLYKTGDLAYWREDGNIAYVGRNDFQVKIRGLRIELGEIENAIDCVDGISQAVVVVRKNAEGRQLICAFYTQSEDVSVETIRAALEQKLPRYMLPHIFTVLDEMPLTSSGKANRKALPEIDLNCVESSTEYVKPEGELEKQLAKLMEQALAYAPVGRNDHFFDLGGDSLKAIEMISKAHTEGIYVSLQNVFDYPTVQQLADCIVNGDKQVISFADMDFSGIDRVLAKNCVENIRKVEHEPLGNILLAGATGFLGIHILANYLENDCGTAYCLVRGKDEADSKNRLDELLRHYFGETYVGSERIKVICADLQKDCFGLSEKVYTELLSNVDTVINTAASVKHYGSYRYFYEVNVESVHRLIRFCKEADVKLIHTSTISVSGNSFADQFDGYVSETEKHFYESSLYIGQPLDNVYARSKFEAEKAILDAMQEGLRANIMRMGNLTNRLSDGMFQRNHESNAFLQRIRGALELGMIPVDLLDGYTEFTPIDEAASAIMTIARHFSSEFTVFHINTPKIVLMDKLVEYCRKLGYALNTVSGKEFEAVLKATAQESGMEHIFEAFINDMDENGHLNYDSNIRIENDFTAQYLKMLGFEWSDIEFAYLEKYVRHFEKIGYFDSKEIMK